MKKALLALGCALVLALGGVGVANLAAGADHSGTGKQHSPESTEHGKPDDHGQSGAEHSKKMHDFAQQHREGMKRWQDCHRAGRANCVKPIPPGWAKHPEKHPGGWPPKHESEKQGSEVDDPDED